ncbi:uncharacterized protein LOC114544215 [Dendronephthya gigantea]|uniref:uncharacterized protein LOC114544215 n=1 Tax=Dendronephthya gigantea TaxID=151771 RepID=UPI00106D0B5D|nr:uncharacterized protein LOC114544215 [Dendronephthya gigantea]
MEVDRDCGQKQDSFRVPCRKKLRHFFTPNFIPVFLDETNTLFSSFTLEQEARSVCGGNEECLYDIAVTGKKDIGEATLESFNEIQKRTNASKLVAKRIFFGCDGVENSGKKVDFCGDCGGDNSSCTDCEGRIRPGFLNNETCGSYLPWSEWSVCIGVDEKVTRERNRTCSKKGHCRHLGNSIQQEKCKTSEDDDDRKALKFYAAVIGIPVVAIILIIAIAALCKRCCCSKISSTAPANLHVSNHQNNSYIM